MNILMKIIQRWTHRQIRWSHRSGRPFAGKDTRRDRASNRCLDKKQNEAKEEAVDNDLLKEQHPSMKFQKESNTRVTFGGTKKS